MRGNNYIVYGES